MKNFVSIHLHYNRAVTSLRMPIHPYITPAQMCTSLCLFEPNVASCILFHLCLFHPAELSDFKTDAEDTVMKEMIQKPDFILNSSIFLT